MTPLVLAALKGKKLEVLALLKQGANPFYKIGTVWSPIYCAADNAPELIPILLDPKNMTEEYQVQFEQVKNTYLLTAMMGAIRNHLSPNTTLLIKLLRQYRGNLSDTIPFFYEPLYASPTSLIFTATQCHSPEPLEILINCGAKDVKVNKNGINYAIQALLEEGPLFKLDFLKKLSLLLRINSKRINAYCPKFEGTCLDYFGKENHRINSRYTHYLIEPIQMLIKAGAKAKPETWEYLHKNFGIVPEKKQTKKLLTYFYEYENERNSKNSFTQPSQGMILDIEDKELLNSSFGRSIANRYQKP